MSKILEVYSADWCGPCKQVKSALSALVKSGEVEESKVIFIDIDKNPSEAQKAGVRGIPTLRYIDGEEVVKTTVGMQKPSDLRANILKYIGE